MAASKFTFANSPELSVPEEEGISFFCNDLEEKKKFVYFRRGPFGDPSSACGTDKSKLRKSEVSWEMTSEVCGNGKPIWKITFNNAG